MSSFSTFSDQNKMHIPLSQWRDIPLHRLMLATLVEKLENKLLANSSATRVLEHWIHHYGLVTPESKLQAYRQKHATAPCPPFLQQTLLGASETQKEDVRYRKVQLTAQGKVFSEAENWYLPARLSPHMAIELNTTDRPFGLVVAALNFSRQLIRRESLWFPLPEQWEQQGIPAGSGQPICLPSYLFRHMAVLRNQAGQAFCVVIETYTSEALGFPPPAMPA
ncbi:hypothetical protein CSR02_01510 [Acetobacter pomorum]|uniref:Chorismate lyase n=1 Tax=Acetobacter pomorum TaxID=65959 RepID=A0A2G4RFJ4_9PROT|nr:hypothetical protein [Acetobacter pomorum]PHY95270.1 hypothetical protein CSR02_01510 [Acetobacter pomorum]GBR47499.1 hypothetical protein AA11825_0687 [Acetobacter pomorum DSM 11825]